MYMVFDIYLASLDLGTEGEMSRKGVQTLQSTIFDATVK